MAASGDTSTRSLYVQLLDWIMVPLALALPVAIITIHLVAADIARQPYDRDLRDTVHSLARHARKPGAAITADTLGHVSDLVRYDERDTVLYQFATARQELLAGDIALPMLAAEEIEPSGEVKFRDVSVETEPYRIAYLVFRQDGSDPVYVIQVGETLNKRRQLAGEITQTVMVVLLLLLTMLLALMSYGLRRGLAPLEELHDSVRRRDPDDLSPIPEGQAPSEVEPLVETLNRQVRRVEQSIAGQRRFIADAAHQLRTPLAGLKTQAELAQRTTDQEALQSHLAHMVTSADRATRMIGQLMSQARADEAALVVQYQTHDLNDLLRTACELASAAALEKGLDFGFEPAPHPVLVAGNAVLLGEMFSNLLDNAIKYSQRGGRVTARVLAEPAPTVEIEDQGIGIPDDEREQVFERFYRVLGTDATGSGLGLSIVKAIATRHGATVALAPAATPPGTCARIVFPAAPVL